MESGNNCTTGRLQLNFLEDAAKVTDRANEHSMCLTEEEALGLLKIVMMCPAELDAEQRDAMLKLSEFCRRFLRDDADQTRPFNRAPRNSSPVQCAA